VPRSPITTCPHHASHTLLRFHHVSTPTLRTRSTPLSLPPPATNPHPTKWVMKGTSVQAANTIHQATMALNPKDSWASSSHTIVPRSTSVEYEKETQSTPILSGRCRNVPNSDLLVRRRQRRQSRIIQQSSGNATSRTPFSADSSSSESESKSDSKPSPGPP
jgi:hypothetical protein